METDRAGMTILDVRTSLELLRSAPVGRIAVIVNDHPEIFPVNYVVDRGTVVFRTAEGTKLASVAFGANVAFEVDGYDADKGTAWSVVMKGRAGEVRGLHERFEAAELPLFPWHASPKPRFVRVEPIEITGRRFSVLDSALRGQPAPQPPKAAVE